LKSGAGFKTRVLVYFISKKIKFPIRGLNRIFL